MTSDEMTTIPSRLLDELMYAADSVALDVGGSAGGKWLARSTDAIRGYQESPAEKPDDASDQDVLTRLKEACNGHPHAKIPWPHRLLHDAIEEILRLRDLAGHPTKDPRGEWAQSAGEAMSNADGGITIVRNENGLTVADLKRVIAGWSETDPHGEPCEVWIGTPDGLSNVAVELCPLNLRGEGKRWADILLEPRHD